jgi:glycogen(starch) synthase
MDHLHGLDYRPTAFRLEWMHEAEREDLESSAFLASLVRELRPDILHLNQFCYGDLPVEVPRVVMVHGDLDHLVAGRCTIAAAPRLSVLDPGTATRCFAGLEGADAVVAPSAWMLDSISACYGRRGESEVIYPGRNPIFFNPLRQ